MRCRRRGSSESLDRGAGFGLGRPGLPFAQDDGAAGGLDNERHQGPSPPSRGRPPRSEEHPSELQSRRYLLSSRTRLSPVLLGGPGLRFAKEEGAGGGLDNERHRGPPPPSRGRPP